MADAPEEESWLKIRRLASLSGRGVKNPEYSSFQSPPSPPPLPLKDDISPYVSNPDTERLVYTSPAIPLPNPTEQRQGPVFSGISIPFLFILAIYSTLLSCVWFLIAVIKPHYGTFISNIGGNISPGTASTLVAGIAKTIELSFVTVFIACLGQFFTKQAFNARSPGISLADIQLKTMIVQPGSLLVQWRSYGLLFKSMLGFLSLLACITGIFYTTASDALVTPVPSLHPAVTMPLLGGVKTSVANVFYLENTCTTPFHDDPAGGQTCLEVESAGSAYHNFMVFMANWTQLTNKNANVPLASRPLPMAQLNDNITVQGSWVEPVSIATIDNRTVTNVSMAIPHAGIVAASALESNRLLQVDANTNAAQLNVDAQTVTPVMNVLCATASESELVPISYKNFTSQNNSITGATWPTSYDSSNWYNNTVFDSIFNFSKARPPPLFYKMPIAFNTLLNDSGAYPDALYVLSKSNVSTTQPYTLCSMSMTIRSGCSSKLRAQVSGSMLSADCSPNNPLAYVATPANNGSTWERVRDWVSVASSWAEAISLKAGITDSDASTARIVTQFAQTNATLSESRPTMPEVLAVLAANTLLDSTADAPFDGQWPFDKTVSPDNIIPTPTLLPFTASVQQSDYASGGSAPWQNIFVLILVPLFILNCLCLAYLSYITLPTGFLPEKLYRLNPFSSSKRGMRGSLVYHRPQHHPYLQSGVQRDFTDLQNLFVLALGTAEPREGSLMHTRTGNFSRSPSPNAAAVGARTWFLDRRADPTPTPRFANPDRRAEREQRHRLLGTKWHIQEKPTAAPAPSRSRTTSGAGLGLGLGGGSSAENTPDLEGRSSPHQRQATAAGANGYHIVVDGEQQPHEGQHHFRRRWRGAGVSGDGVSGSSGGYGLAHRAKERVRGRFEKYLSPVSPRFPRHAATATAAAGKGHSPGSSTDVDVNVDVEMEMDGGPYAAGGLDDRRGRHISAPRHVANSVGFEPEGGAWERERERERDEGEDGRRSGTPDQRPVYGGADGEDDGEESDLGAWRSPYLEGGGFSGTAVELSGGGRDSGTGGGGNRSGGGSSSSTTRLDGEGYEFAELGPGTPGIGREF